MTQTNKPHDNDLRISTEIAQFAIREFVKKLREYGDNLISMSAPSHPQMKDDLHEGARLFYQDLLAYAESLLPQAEPEQKEQSEYKRGFNDGRALVPVKASFEEVCKEEEK